MRIIKNVLVASSLLCAGLPVFSQEDGYFGPISRWGTKPVEPGVVTTKTDVDALKKLSAELAEVKNRLRILEESQGTFNQHVKSQFVNMNESLKTMQTYCDKLQVAENSTSMKPVITQTGAVVPATTPALDNATMSRIETYMKNMEAMNKRFEELNKKHEDTAIQLQDLTKLALQVQANTRDVVDLKKKVETQERDVIQAQSDIGKLQQDLARANVRPGTTDQSRSSMSLPLPPEQQHNTQQSRSGFTPAATNFSTVRLVNAYPSMMTIIVDGQIYTLSSNQTLSLNKNPGYFTYEVLGVQGNTLRSLVAGETMTIQVVPR